MKLIGLLIAISFVATMANAHGTHDWSTDTEAFAGATVDTKIYTNEKNTKAAIVISEAEFKFKLEQLSGAQDILINNQKVRIQERGSAAGRELSRQWLTQEYRAMGFNVFQHSYEGGANLIAEKPGTSGKVLILSAHMDSVGNSGANDDGAGTVAALLIAKSLKDFNSKHTLRIVAFDNEEQGLVGSSKYVKTLNPAQIIGDIQMEMMAYNSRNDGKFHVIDCDRSDSLFLTESVMKTVQSLGLPLTRVKACTDRSDHSAFWSQKIPAIVLSENFFGGDGDRCYHKKCDILDERLNLKYSSFIATAVANAIVGLMQ